MSYNPLFHKVITDTDEKGNAAGGLLIPGSVPVEYVRRLARLFCLIDCEYPIKKAEQKVASMERSTPDEC